MGRPAGWMTGVDGAVADEVAGGAVASAGGRAGVLAGDRQGAAARGGRRRWWARRRRSGAGGSATVAACHRSICRRSPAGTCRSLSARRSRCCSAQGVGVREIARVAGPCAVDDQPGAAPQRGHPWREAGLPGVGGAVEGRAGRPATQDREAGRRTRGCASTCRSGCPGRSLVPTGQRWPATHGRLDRAEQAAPQGPSVGSGLEPGADREPAQGRLPR